MVKMQNSAEDKEGRIADLLIKLDGKSRNIIWYLYQHGHADLAALRDAAALESDMTTLFYIKDRINATAKELWGRPLVVFYPRRLAPGSGELVFYHWWLDLTDSLTMDRGIIDILDDGEAVAIVAEVEAELVPALTEVRQCNGFLSLRLPKATAYSQFLHDTVNVEIMEESEKVTLILEVPGMMKENIRIYFCREGIEIAGLGNRCFQQVVALNKEVSPEMSWRYHNGILQITLKKWGQLDADGNQ